MNLRRPYAKLVLTIAVVLLLGLVVPATLSYITDRTDSLVNTFKPEYTPTGDASVDVYVQKTVTNLTEPAVGPENFQFLLTRTDTEKSIQLITGKDGRAHAALTFSKADAGKTYTYKLTEVNDGRENMVYDDTIYTISVTLSLQSDASLATSVTLDGLKVDKVEAAFTNVHTTEVLPPDTGDDAQPLLYAVMMALGLLGMSALVIFRKKHAA